MHQHWLLVIGYGKDWDIGIPDTWRRCGSWSWIINGKIAIGTGKLPNGFGLWHWRWRGPCAIISRRIDQTCPSCFQWIIGGTPWGCPFPSRLIPGRGVTGFYLWHRTTMLYDILSWLVLIRVLTYTLVIVNLIC